MRKKDKKRERQRQQQEADNEMAEPQENPASEPDEYAVDLHHLLVLHLSYKTSPDLLSLNSHYVHHAPLGGRESQKDATIGFRY